MYLIKHTIIFQPPITIDVPITILKATIIVKKVFN